VTPQKRHKLVVMIYHRLVTIGTATVSDIAKGGRGHAPSSIKGKLYQGEGYRYTKGTNNFCSLRWLDYVLVFSHTACSTLCMVGIFKYVVGFRRITTAVYLEFCAIAHVMCDYFCCYFFFKTFSRFCEL